MGHVGGGTDQILLPEAERLEGPQEAGGTAQGWEGTTRGTVWVRVRAGGCSSAARAGSATEETRGEGQGRLALHVASQLRRRGRQGRLSLPGCMACTLGSATGAHPAGT